MSEIDAKNGNEIGARCTTHPKDAKVQKAKKIMTTRATQEPKLCPRHYQSSLNGIFDQRKQDRTSKKLMLQPRCPPVANQTR